ncbi:hypothetical protein EDB85DRAFT_2275450 [Lactarius pseudohatsudake]|nr:hypothetical protein EDB85DRAFT_2275450 [Lactarius pseudohatsudake]
MGDMTSTRTHTCQIPIPGLMGMGSGGPGYGFRRVAWVPEPARVGTAVLLSSSSALDPSTSGSFAWGLEGVKVSQGVTRCLARFRGTRAVVQWSREQKWGRLVAGGRKQSCMLVHNLKLCMCGRLGWERVVFESLRPHANVACWGMQGIHKCNSEVAVAAMPVWRWRPCRNGAVGWGRVNDGGAGVAVPVRGDGGDLVEVAPWCPGGSRVSGAGVSRPQRCGRVTVEGSGYGCEAVAKLREWPCPVEMSKTKKKKKNSSEWAQVPRARRRRRQRYGLRTHVSGRPGGLGARMARAVKAVGGGLDEEGDTVLACTG